MAQRIRYSRAVGYLLFIAGSSLSVWLGNAVWQGYATHTWVAAKGIVYQSEMVEQTRRGSEALVSYDLSYRYQFQSDSNWAGARPASHTGTRVYRTDLPINSEQQIQTLLDQYPVGSIQTVYVDPDNPQEAVLIRGVSVQLLMAFVFALACFGVGLIGLRSSST